MVSLEDMLKEEDTLTKKKTEEKKKSGSSETVGDVLKNVWNKKSPDKDLETYRDHALNWDNKDSTGKIIRGTEGLVGGLDKAIVEVVVGIFQKMGELFTKKDGQ